VAPVAFAMPYLASSMAKYVRHGYLALTVSPKPYFAQVKSDFALYIYLVISRYWENGALANLHDQLHSVLDKRNVFNSSRSLGPKVKPEVEKALVKLRFFIALERLRKIGTSFRDELGLSTDNVDRLDRKTANKNPSLGHVIKFRRQTVFRGIPFHALEYVGSMACFERRERETGGAKVEATATFLCMDYQWLLRFLYIKQRR